MPTACIGETELIQRIKETKKSVYLGVGGAEWDEIEQAPDSQLVATLAMQCPFTFEEKQALLEAPSIEDRAELIVSLLTMAVAGHLNTSVTRH